MSDSFLLSKQERERFATWLERHIESSKGIITQMETLPSAVADVLVTKKRREMAACLIVAQMIRNTEEVTVGRANESI